MSDDSKHGRNIYDLLSEWGEGLFYLALIFIMSLPLIFGNCK
jgi:hypothetical protein